MSTSTHKCEVVPVTLEKHPNADSLSVVRLFDGGYSVCVRTQDWQDGQLGVYLPPDSVVNTTRTEFAFLADGKSDTHRLKAKKLRGIVSFGLLIHAPDGAAIGDDMAEQFGVTHYEPPVQLSSKFCGGEAESPPSLFSGLGKYDVDSLRRYPNVFYDGELVQITEKIHGCNGSFVFSEGRMWVRSRSEWKKCDAENLWWRVLGANPSIESFCQTYPGHILYGEVYGQVQDLKYGSRSGELFFAAFDVMQPDRTFINADDARDMLCESDVPCVPLIRQGMPYSFEAVCELAEGQSLIRDAGHVREGCVVRPLDERWDARVGRVILKVVGAGYLERKG